MCFTSEVGVLITITAACRPSTQHNNAIDLGVLSYIKGADTSPNSESRTYGVALHKASSDKILVTSMVNTRVSMMRGSLSPPYITWPFYADNRNLVVLRLHGGAALRFAPSKNAREGYIPR